MNKLDSCLVLGQRVDIVDYRSASEIILRWASGSDRHKYVCVSNVHMIMEGNDVPEFRALVNEADLVVADGMPLVWMMRHQGVRDAVRVRGPDLTRTLLTAVDANIPIGFLGGCPTTLSLLLRNIASWYPRALVSFAESPPFRALSDVEDVALVDRINASGAKVLFVGLGCPKQERWMADHRICVNAVLVGVGAAFDFIAGTRSEAPLWMQRSGLEWSYRLLREPRRLWRRYVWHNSRFILSAAKGMFLRSGE